MGKQLEKMIATHDLAARNYLDVQRRFKHSHFKPFPSSHDYKSITVLSIGSLITDLDDYGRDSFDVENIGGGLPYLPGMIVLHTEPRCG